MDTLGRLVGLRVALKKKQQDVAKYAGISRCALSRCEKGRAEMKLSVAEKYAEFLGFELRLIVK